LQVWELLALLLLSEGRFELKRKKEKGGNIWWDFVNGDYLEQTLVTVDLFLMDI